MPNVVAVLRPRVAFITGASSGIGRALAVSLARTGVAVAVAARRLPALEELAREIERDGGRALPIALDVRDVDAVVEAVKRVDRELGSLDMVIANAGVGFHGHSSTMPWSDIEQILAVNVRGAMATLTAAIPIMLAQQRGHLVGVSSLAGRRGLPSAGAYSASKAALSTFLEALRIDLRAAGIKVTDVRPGFVETALTEMNKRRPMPFLWPLDRAVNYITQRLEHAPPVIAFPKPLTFLTSLGRLLPPWMYDSMVRKLQT